MNKGNSIKAVNKYSTWSAQTKFRLNEIIKIKEIQKFKKEK